MLKCFPLQFADSADRSREKWLKDMRMKELGTDHPSCREKLEKYYRILGFMEVGKTEFMMLNPYHVQPGFDTLGFS